MTDNPAITTDAEDGPEPADDSLGAREVRMLERHLRQLEEMGELGMEIVRGVGRQGAHDPEAAASFDDITRTVRLTMAMEQRTFTALQRASFLAGLDAEKRREVQEEAEAMLQMDRVATEVCRVVEETARADADADAEKIENLVTRAYERLTDHERYTNVLSWPIGKAVDRICKDLGLEPDWRRWAREAWAVEEAEANALGSPYGELRPAKPAPRKTTPPAPKAKPAKPSRPIEPAAMPEPPPPSPPAPQPPAPQPPAPQPPAPESRDPLMPPQAYPMFGYPVDPINKPERYRNDWPGPVPPR